MAIATVHPLQETSPFQRLAATMEDLSGDGGVLKKQLKVGIGLY